MLSFELKSSLVCVGVLRFVSCVCCSSLPYSALLCEHLCKGERLQVVEIPREWDLRKAKQNIVVFKWVFGPLERG